MSASCQKQTWCHRPDSGNIRGDYRREILAVCGTKVRSVLPMKIRNRWHCNSSFEPRRAGWKAIADLLKEMTP
jgi:hypothetical protein